MPPAPASARLRRSVQSASRAWGATSRRTPRAIRRRARTCATRPASPIVPPVISARRRRWSIGRRRRSRRSPSAASSPHSPAGRRATRPWARRSPPYWRRRRSAKSSACAPRSRKPWTRAVVAQAFRRRVDFCGGGSHSPAIMKALSDRLRTVPVRPAPQDDRNPGMPLDLDVVRALRVNRSAVERRAATIPTRRTVKKEWQAAWLLRAITCMDLTTLQGDDTPGNVLRLCAKARRPLRPDLVDTLGVGHLDIKVGAVCVYHALVPTAVAALEGSDIPVAAVSTGFPAGLNPFAQRLEEVQDSVAAGAQEIDIVITRAHVLTGDWPALYAEVRAFRDACGRAHMKAILGTGELATLTNVARASMVAMMAGADFIKTSTGKEPVNAVLPVGVVMARMIREYEMRTGAAIGFKPAGGIRAAKQALDWMILMKEELGDRWLKPALFRLGASSLLTDIERQFEHYINGRWVAPSEGQYFETINPATKAVLARVAQGSKADVDAAVAAANGAAPLWAGLSTHARARYLYALAREVQRHSRLLAVLESMDNGKPIRETRDLDIPLVARHFYHHAGWAQLLATEFPGYV